jgi:hypothetical protein
MGFDQSLGQGNSAAAPPARMRQATCTPVGVCFGGPVRHSSPPSGAIKPSVPQAGRGTVLAASLGTREGVQMPRQKFFCRVSLESWLPEASSMAQNGDMPCLLESGLQTPGTTFFLGNFGSPSRSGAGRGILQPSGHCDPGSPVVPHADPPGPQARQAQSGCVNAARRSS